MKAVNRDLWILVALLSVIHAPSALAWTTKINCLGPPGARVQQGGVNEFTNAFTNTIYSNAQLGPISQSCQMRILAGSDGWDSWGGIYQFPTELRVGSQLWIRLSLYVPTGFNYTGNPMLKFMRVHTASATVKNQGYLDLYINPPTGTVWDYSLKKDVAAPFTFYYEGHPRPHTLGVRPQNDIALGSWQTYEIYYKLDSVSKSQGGTGEIRIWQNDKLLTDMTDQVTLKDPTTYANEFYLFTYWNGNAPNTQYLYVTDVTITTDDPSNRDSNGNPCVCAPPIGPQPEAPQNVSVH